MLDKIRSLPINSLSRSQGRFIFVYIFCYYLRNKMKNRKCHTVGRFPYSNRKCHTVGTFPYSNRKCHTVGTFPNSNRKCHTVGTFPYSNRIIVEIGRYPSHKYMTAHWLGTGTFNKM